MGPWEGALQRNNVNKFIFMAPKNRIDNIRPLVATEIGDIAKLTQAQSNMLEVLPKGCSKGDGVRRLLNSLGVNPRNILAIGDAENVSVARSAALCTLFIINFWRYIDTASLP